MCLTFFAANVANRRRHSRLSTSLIGDSKPLPTLYKALYLKTLGCVPSISPFVISDLGCF